MKNLIKCFQISCVFFLAGVSVANACEVAAPPKILSPGTETDSTDGSDVHNEREDLKYQYTIRILLANAKKNTSSNHENEENERKKIDKSVTKYLIEHLKNYEEAESLRKIIDLPSEELKISGLLTLFAKNKDSDDFKKLAEHILQLSAKKNDLMTINFYKYNGLNISEPSMKLQNNRYVQNVVLSAAKYIAKTPELIVENIDELISILIPNTRSPNTQSQEEPLIGCSVTVLTKEEIEKILADAKPVKIRIQNANLPEMDIPKNPIRSCNPQFISTLTSQTDSEI